MNDLAFYEAAAQVIPVLLLVLIFEARVMEYPSFSQTRVDRFAAGAFLVIVAFGEVSALAVLQRGKSVSGASFWVWLALVMEFVILFSVATFRRRPRQRAEPNDGPE